MTPPTSHDDLLREMERHELRRRRRYWILMSFLVGLPLATLFLFLGMSITNGGKDTRVLKWIGAALPLLWWQLVCSVNVLRTFRSLSLAAVRGGAILLTPVLAALHAAIVIGLFWAGCMILMGGRIYF